MKIKFMFKSIGCILAVIMMLQITPCAFAHTTSQEGILAKSYMDHKGYEDYFIGGEDVGWSINEKFHTNGTKIYYSIIGNDMAKYKDDIASGASKWSGIVNIVNQTGYVTGKIVAYNDPEDTRTAVTSRGPSISGHLPYWTIRINLAYTVSDTTIAHEFGHVIGLNDLYWTKNFNKLMCGYRDVRTATGPTTSDKLGAQVITGQHTSHTWGYKSYQRLADGTSNHVKYCTVCNGYCASSDGKKPLVYSCTYNSVGICTTCRARKQEISINSTKPDLE